MHTYFSFYNVLLCSGEVAVKLFEAAQTGLPMCALGAVLGPLRLNTRYNMRLPLVLVVVITFSHTVLEAFDSLLFIGLHEKLN